MFDRFTERARRVIFFARYEAARYGSPYIESEHMLLAVFREDRTLLAPLCAMPGGVESFRGSVKQHATVRGRSVTSFDIPLSNACKHILAYAAEEAQSLGHQHIGTEHILLGILRESGCFAAKLLAEQRVSLESLREEVRNPASKRILPT